ncbi:hypothetical protein [Arcanobacterium canis]
MNDEELLARVGMTLEQAENNSVAAESEDVSDGLVGQVYYGLHFAQEDETMTTISLRIPKSLADRLQQPADLYHLNRSEYIRRQLAKA